MPVTGLPPSAEGIVSAPVVDVGAAVLDAEPPPSDASPFDISIVSYIGFFIGIVLIYMKKHRYIGDFLFGIGLLLLGLTTLKATGMSMDLANNDAVTSFFKSFDPTVYIVFF